MTINIYFLPHWFATINITYLPYHCIFSPLNTLKMPHIYLTFQNHNVYVWTNAVTKWNDRNIMFFSHRNRIVARELLVHQYLWHDAILNVFRCLYVSFVRTLTTYFKDTSFFGRPHTEVYRVIWSLVITSFSKLKIKTVYFFITVARIFSELHPKTSVGQTGLI